MLIGTNVAMTTRTGTAKPARASLAWVALCLVALLPVVKGVDCFGAFCTPSYDGASFPVSDYYYGEPTAASDTPPTPTVSATNVPASKAPSPAAAGSTAAGADLTPIPTVRATNAASAPSQAAASGPTEAGTSPTPTASATNVQESRAELKQALSKVSRKCKKFCRQAGHSATSCREVCEGLTNKAVSSQSSNCDMGGSLFARGGC